jgi:PKD repeat protein
MSLTIIPDQTFEFSVGQYSSVSVEYNYTGSNTLIWSAVGLPLGLSIDQHGNIYGTPTNVGSRSSYITVTDPTLRASSVIKFNIANNNSTNITEFFVSPSTTGYAGITPFQFTLTLASSLTGAYILWDFGDKSLSNQQNPSHIYEVPGQYNVVLNVYSETQNVTLTSAINVNLLLNESIYFDFVPPPTFAGHLNRYPFTLTFTSSVSGPHYIDLAAQFSRSYQTQNPRNKWSFLRPEWRFLDLAGNPISSIVPSENPIYANEFGIVSDPVNGFFAGVTGTASFYFVDDIYNFDLVQSGHPYTTLIATLRTSAIRSFHDSFNADYVLPSYSNSLATASCPYTVLWRNPDNIEITENGVRDYINPRWPSAVQPLVAYTNYATPYPDPWVDGNGASDLWNPNSYAFCHNIPVNADPILINLVSVGFSANFVPQPTEFQWIDDTGYEVPGYYKGSFVTNISNANNVSLSANLTYKTPVLSSQYVNPTLWISNPEAGMMANVQYIYNPALSATFDTPNLNIAQVYPFNMPIITQPDFVNDPMALSGFHGINAIASLPAPTYHAWALDSELNYLYRINTLGQILCAIDINDVVTKNNLGFLVNNQISPVGLALDGQQNIWMTLYDTVSTLKFDSAGNFLFAVTPLSSTGYTIPPNIDPLWYDQTTYYEYREDSPYDHNQINIIDINYIEPTGIDTDRQNNVWVSYSSFLSGYLIKYDQNGGLLYTNSYPVCSCPQSIVVGDNDNVWIALSNNIYPSSPCYIEKRDTNGNLLSSFGPILGLNKLTLDINQNPWFTFSYSWVGSIDNTSGTIFTTNLSGTGDTTYAADWFDPNLNTDETALEGIGCDILGNVYVINSIENQIYVLDVITKQFVNKFYINPQGFTFYLNDQYQPTQMSVSLWNKSAQADGDWTGLNWYNKYANNIPQYTSTTQNITITGRSVPLNFLNFLDNNIFKANENFDLAGSMQSLAFSPALAESEFLFNNFLGSIYGKYPFKHNDVGVKMYEKIANYVSNISDIDYCNVKEIYNLAKMMDINLQDFNLNYPEEVERVINFASVNLSRLLGARSVEQDSFIHPNSQGMYNMNPKPITSLNYMVTAGIPLVLEDRSLNKYRSINTGYINCSAVYTLVDFAKYLGFTNPNWPSYYQFHQFIPNYDGTQVAGLVDWNNPQTTIKENLSSANDWFGTGNLIDTQFSYELYKGLGLI